VNRKEDTIHEDVLVITIVSFAECNRGFQCRSIYIYAESLHRSSIGRARAPALLSCSTRSPTSFLAGRSSHPPGNREAVTSYHSYQRSYIMDHSTLKIPSSTELPSTSLRCLEPQYSGTLALAVEDVLLITNSPTKAIDAGIPLCQQIRGSKAQNLPSNAIQPSDLLSCRHSNICSPSNCSASIRLT
jgi:hypothetical protein